MPPVDTISKVAEFHRAFDQPIAPAPDVPRLEFIERTELTTAAIYLRKVRSMLREHAHSVAALRVALIVEELSELADALADGNAVETLDALVDLRYVTDGTVLTYGLHTIAPDWPERGSRFDRAFDRVHASNMSKLGADGKPVKDECGKIVKGPGYVKPDLRDLVK